MLAEARSVPHADNSEDRGVIVYEGFFTALITHKLNLSVPYYTSIRKALIRMGCVRQLKRGGGSAPSQWELVYEPTLEAFMRQEEPKTPKQTKESQTEALVDSLLKRMQDVEDTQQEIIQLLAKQLGTEPATEEVTP